MPGVDFCLRPSKLTRQFISSPLRRYKVAPKEKSESEKLQERERDRQTDRDRERQRETHREREYEAYGKTVRGVSDADSKRRQ